MDLIKCFAQVVRNGDQCVENNQNFKHLPIDIQSAILRKDGDRLKLLLAGTQYLANESHVVQIQA